MTVVLNASAILAFAQGEPGSELVAEALQAGAICGAADWSEVAQKVLAAGKDWDLVKALLGAYGLTVADVTADHGERAARRWVAGSGLSLADRLCLALADAEDASVLTADRAWGGSGRVRQIR